MSIADCMNFETGRLRLDWPNWIWAKWRLAHGGSQRVRDVTVRAFPGALLGPPWARRENALCATGGGEPSDGGLFYEPHGEWGADSSLAELAPEVSILVAPAVAMKVGPLFELLFMVSPAPTQGWPYP